MTISSAIKPIHPSFRVGFRAKFCVGKRSAQGRGVVRLQAVVRFQRAVFWPWQRARGASLRGHVGSLPACVDEDGRWIIVNSFFLSYLLVYIEETHRVDLSSG